MLGIGLLILIGIWAAVGFLLWRRLIRPKVRSRPALVLTTVVAAVVWFVGPIADEMIGARRFKTLCEEMPPVEFYGPVAIGPGAFFDKSGQPRWHNGDEFSSIKRMTKDWSETFGTKDDEIVLESWPFPIVELKITDYERSTGNPVVVSRMRAARGGWLKRLSGMGALGGYQCPIKGPFVDDINRIKYRQP